MKSIFFFLLSLFLFSCSDKYKIGYININQVFDEFIYKKELEKDLNAVKNSRKFLLDSLSVNLNMLATKYRQNINNKDVASEFQNYRMMFLEKKAQIEEEENELVQQFDEKIIKQLNSYVKKYGSENKFSIIYGSTSNGNIMYGDSSLDLSKDVIKYINEKYSGK